jgi:hypothetical protein
MGLVQRSKRDRDPREPAAVLFPSILALKACSFQLSQHSLGILHSNVNLLDRDLALIARPFCFCMYFNGSSTCKLLWCNKDKGALY